METTIINTTKFLLSRICVFLCALPFLVVGSGTGARAIGLHYREAGWIYRVMPEITQTEVSILFYFTMLLFLVSVYFLLIGKTQGVIELSDNKVCTKQDKTRYIKFKNGKEIFFGKKKQIKEIELMHSEIFSIQLLLDSSKEKPIYAREYFKGAENNWLIIKMKNGKEYKIEILIKSLAMERELVDYLDQLKEKNIQISYGTKHKTLLHAIRCAF